MSTRVPRGPARTRRWRRVGWGVFITVGALLALVVVALGIVSSPFGGERVRRFVVPRVNEAIAGQIEVGRLLVGLGGVELWDVTLRDPEGAVVLRSARVKVGAVVTRLLANKVDLTDVVIERPHVDLVQSARGLNLTRAIAAREPRPEEPKSEPSDLEIVLRDFRLSDGSVSLRDTRPGAGPPILVEAMQSSASGSVVLPGGRYEGRFALDARSRQPLAAPLSVRFDGAGTGAEAKGDLALAWAGTRLEARLRSLDATTQSIALSRAQVSPALVRAFVPGSPLRALVGARGELERRGDDLDLALVIDAGGSRARLSGAIDLGRLEARPLRLEWTQINLAALLAGAPPSRFDLTVDARGGGRDLASANGQVRVHVPAGLVDGRPLGPVRAEAAANAGRWVLRALDVALPGLTVTGRGAGGPRDMAVEATIVASDLALTARSLRLAPGTPIVGRGRLAVQVEGPPAAPGLDLSGQFPVLRVGGNAFAGVRLSGRIQDLAQAPARSDVRVQAASARLGRHTFADVELAVASTGREGFRVDLRTAGALPVALHAAGRNRDGGALVELDRLTLSYPEASWSLTRPARLRRAPDLLAVEGLTLAAAPGQSIALDLARRGSRIDAAAKIAGLDLARLPSLALPPGPRPAGRLDVDLVAKGRLPRPEANVQLRLAGGAFRGFRDVGVTLEARHRAGRVAGQLVATVLGAQHSATFDLPIAWPPPAAARVELAAVLGRTDLARLPQASGAAAPARPRLGGTVEGTVEISGNAGDPSIALAAKAHGLALTGNAQRIETLAIDLSDPNGRPLVLDVAATVLGRRSHARIESPVVLAQWLRRPPRPEALSATPFAARATIDQLPLAALMQRQGARRPPIEGGTATARVALDGPLTRLRGTLGLEVVDVRGPRLPPTSARLQANLREGKGGLDARLAVFRQGRAIADLDGAVGLGIDDLIARRGVASAPLRIKGRVGPIGLQRLAAGAEGVGRRKRPLRARIEAALAATGTLGDPRAELRVTVQNARLDGKPLGDAGLRAFYADARSRVELRVATAGGGQLALDAGARADLSLPAVLRGIDVNEIPVESKLSARKLDLVFLSGLHDAVRIVEGQLDAQATVNGRVGAPQLVGQLGWQRGRLVLAGFGEMRDIELKLKGDPREMVLERLFARAGSGSATVTGKAIREGDGRRLAVEARADVDRFRVQTQGQPLGAVSLDATARGTVAPDGIDIRTSISEAHMELAPGDRRRLQPLSRPDDIVVLVNGEPADRAQERLYEKLTKPASAAEPNGDGQGPGAKALAVAGHAASEVAAAVPNPPPRRTRITIDAPRNLWVRGADVNLELGFDPDFVVAQSDATRVFGTLRIRRGFVVVLGRRFDIKEDSSLRFTGPPDRPTLAIDATYRAESAETTVAAHVAGTGEDLRFTLTSPEHPEYGDTELLTLIATGRLPEESGGAVSAGSKAASLVGGLLADRVQKVLTQHLPIDVLSIEPGDEMTGTRLEAGTYLGEDLYVAYVGRVGGDQMTLRENRNELHLEYQLTPRWSFEATYGDARQGSVDLLWTRNY